jgi:hypothetical protein
MADNERIQRNISDLPYGQLAPSQVDRESWYPGKRPADIKPGDATWDRHYRSPVGVERFEGPQGPLEIQHVRIEKLGRNIICDQTIAGPQGLGSKTTTIDDDTTWGTGTDPEHTLDETATQDVNGEQERRAGYDWPIGLQSP